MSDFDGTEDEMAAMEALWPSVVTALEGLKRSTAWDVLMPVLMTYAARLTIDETGRFDESQKQRLRDAAADEDAALAATDALFSALDDTFDATNPERN